MSDRCEHGARNGNCDERHPPNLNNIADRLEFALDNLKAIDTWGPKGSRMLGVDVIGLGRSELILENIIEELRRS